MEEELGRSTGVFWAPPSAQTPGVDMLLCARIDECAVLEVGLPELPVESKINPLGTLVPTPTALFADDAFGWPAGCRSAEGPLTEHHRYPRPGTPTATTDWAVVEIEHGPSGIGRRRVRTLRGPFRLQTAVPWCEYVVRAGWLPADTGVPPAVWLQLLDRAQQRTAIVRIALACFDSGTEMPVDPLEQAPRSADGVPADARIDILYEERQPGGWINLSHGHRFLARSTARCVQFILATERAGGFCHLYLITSHIRPPSSSGGVAVAHARVEATALTAGAWPVTADGPLFVDERRRLVFFAARRPNPLTENLFAVSYGPALATPTQTAPPPPLWQLTLMGYTHSHFSFDGLGAYFACQSSNLATPARHCVYQIAYSGNGLAVTAQCVAALEPHCRPAMVGAQGALADSVHRAASGRASRRLSGASTASSLSLRSMSVESLAPDEFFVERLLAKLRASGQQIQHSGLASDLAKLKRLTPAYVSQRVTKAVKSALPFCSAPTTAPLHLLSSALFPPPRPDGLPRRPAGRIRNPRLSPPPPLRSSLTSATHAFVARESLLGTHATGMREQCQGGDPVPRLFCFPVPRIGAGPGDYDLLFGHVYLPPGFSAGERYPVVVNAYGGPQCQLVTNAYAYPRHRRLAMLTRMAVGPLPPRPWPPPPPDGHDSNEDDDDDWASLWARPPSPSDVVSDGDGSSARRTGTRSLYASAEAELAGAVIAEAARQPAIAAAAAGQAAAQPVVVVCVDGRGTPFRGLAFEAAIRGRLGQIEVDDIACALDYLCEYGTACLESTTRVAPHWCRGTVSTTPVGASGAVSRPPVFAPPGCPPLPAGHWDPAPAERSKFVDCARIAIHGWSYGGYVALRAMAARPSLFRVAVAGAPVVRWDWYSAAYTERYLGVHPLLPTAQPAPATYAQASVTAVAAQLAAAAGRILIVHGWGDDNVHVAHTAELVRELSRHTAVPPGVAVYANERHGLRLPASNEHYETLLAYWLFRSLQSS
ncbi:hypothetical protein H4R19_003096 [Coemansia spiralis]|nr:hypothetical protein H4R19_003096 [Coemansia spiralis]